jgi:hypothetical protein
LSESDLDNQQKLDLKQIGVSCQNVLKDLEKTLEKYGEVVRSHGPMSKKIKKVWKRLQWEPDDVRELRDRITSNITLLNTYLERVSR